MKLYTFEESAEDYERLTGESFEFNIQYENLKLLDSNEFMTWRIGERFGYRFFEIRQTYGFVKNFVPWIEKMMKENNINLILTMTQRSPKAHIRKWKMAWMKDWDYDFEGRHYHVLLGNIANLK